MNNTYRPPGGRPPVGINTPMAPTPPTPLNRANQLMANDRAQNAAIKSSSYTGNAANAPTLNKASMAQPVEDRQAAMRAAQAAAERARTTAYLGGSSANTPPPASAAPKASDAHMQAAQRAADLDQIRARPMPMPPTGGGVGANPLPMPPTGPIGGGIGANPPPTPAPAPGGFGSGPAPSTGAVFRKGGNVKAYAKGGKVSSASSRGDGIASKGKTRGKMY